MTYTPPQIQNPDKIPKSGTTFEIMEQGRINETLLSKLANFREIFHSFSKPILNEI